VNASRGRRGQHDARPARRPSSSRCGRPIRTRACARSRKSASRSGRGGDAWQTGAAAPREGAKQRRPPSFSARISKSRLFGSKLFQTILWRFCGISRGYKGSKPNLMTPNFFGPPTPFRSHSGHCYAPSPRAVGVRRAFNGSRQKKRGRVHGGAIRIERILKLARILILGNEMSLSFTADRGANPA
jgi:hypothetical protein